MAAPVVSSVTFSPAGPVAPGTTVTLTVVAADADNITVIGSGTVQETGQVVNTNLQISDPVEFVTSGAGPQDVLVTVKKPDQSLVPLTPTATPGVYTFVAPGS